MTNVEKKQKTSHVETSSSSSSSSSSKIKDESDLQAILSPRKIKDFFDNFWENEPLLIQEKDAEERKDLLKRFNFSKKTFEELVSREKLIFENDIHVCKCVDGETKNLNESQDFKVKHLKKFYNMGATIQFHQPQRFCDELWKSMEKLECYFCSLVGANVYITPNGTQGLAPHYDDVEVFIIQLEGEKKWKLYKAPIKLPVEGKINLPASEIGKPTHEFTLKPGDVLYMPRGTIHEAESTNETATGHSTHITISTYQKQSYGEYLKSSVKSVVNFAIAKSESLRKGLPFNFFAKKMDKASYLNLLKLLGESIESEEDIPPPKGLACPFMCNRLPPYKIDASLLEETPDGNGPTLDSQIRYAYPDHVLHWFDRKEEGDGLKDEDMDEDDNSENSSIKEIASEKESEEDCGGGMAILLTTLWNNRSLHMVEDASPFESTGIFQFPKSYLKSFDKLQEGGLSWTRVKDLPLESADEKVQLATALWTQHIVQNKNEK